VLFNRRRSGAARVSKNKDEDEEEKRRLALQHQRTEDAACSQGAGNSSASGWLHELVGSDGSFGRTYVCLKDYESRAFGRPIMVDLPIFNEWALQDAGLVNFLMNKPEDAPKRRPYQIGTLSVQLVYVPRPKDATEEDMPTSINACIREMRVAEGPDLPEWEGFLRQQGGDCPVSLTIIDHDIC
jgi:hypothetical protein